MQKSTKELTGGVIAFLRQDSIGNTDRVCDIVRAMFVVDSMADVAAMLQAFCMFAKEGRIVIVRVKDRFFGIMSAGGWKDIMINFVLAGGPAHVCEVQIVHSQLLTARKGLPGHIGEFGHFFLHVR